MNNYIGWSRQNDMLSIIIIARSCSFFTFRIKGKPWKENALKFPHNYVNQNDWSIHTQETRERVP